MPWREWQAVRLTDKQISQAKESEQGKGSEKKEKEEAGGRRKKRRRRKRKRNGMEGSKCKRNFSVGALAIVRKITWKEMNSELENSGHQNRNLIQPGDGGRMSQRGTLDAKAGNFRKCNSRLELGADITLRTHCVFPSTKLQIRWLSFNETVKL